MKKQLSLLMLFAALIVPWASRAQSHTAVIGNWSGTSSSNYGGFHFYAKYSWTQTLYLEDEIGGAGYIQTITLDNRSSAAGAADSVKIYLGHTTMTSHPTAAVSTWVPMSDLTLVYSDANFTVPADTGDLTIVLDQPYYYNGTGTLVMVISKAAQATSSNTKFGYTSTTAMIKYTGGTTESYCRFPTAAGTNNTYKLNVRFGMTATANETYCPGVSNFRRTGRTTTSVSVAWDVEQGETYQVAYTDADGTVADIVPINDNTGSHTFTGLTPATIYKFWVRHLCTDGDGGWQPLSIGTLLDQPLSMPLSFDFETSSDDGLWLTENAVNGWYVDSLGTGRALFVSNNGGRSNAYTVATTAAASWAWTDVNMSVGGYNISFDWKGKGESNYDYMRVFLVPDTVVLQNTFSYFNQTAPYASRNVVPDGWVLLGSKSEDSLFFNQRENWTHFSGEFTVANAGTYHLAILWANDGSGGTQPPAAIDNISVTEATCYAPTSFAIDAETATPQSVTMNISHPAATDFLLLWRQAGETAFDTVEVSGSSHDFTNLSMGTTYEGYIYTLCGDDTSTGRLPFTFTTGCGTITEDDLPYIEDFEAYGTSSSNPINACWAKGTNSSTAYPYPSSAAAINGSRGLYFYGYYPSSSTGIFTYSWAALPPVDESLDISTLMVTFNAKRYATTTSYYNSYILVGIADSLTFTSALGIDSTVTWIDTINLTSLPASTIEAEEVSFESYYGDGKYVVFYSPVPALSGSNTYAYNYIYIDDIALRTIPTCFWPTEVALEGVTSESAEISWTPDPRTTEPSGWNIEYGLHGFTPGEGETETATDTTVELTNLLPNTAYDVYVSADCGGDESDPTMFTFRTACVALDSLPYTQDFEQETTNTSTTAWAVPCWGHLNNATTNFGYPNLSSTSTYNHTAGGTKGLYWNASNTTGTHGDYHCVVLPAVNTDDYPMNTLQVSFWAKSSSTTTNPVFQVGVMTNPNDINSFEPVGVVTVGGNTTWTEYTVAFGTYTGEGQYPAIKSVRPTTSWTAYVDDITLEEMPSCPPVIAIEATPTVGAALLNWSWQAGYEAPDNYVVTYDSVGGTNPTTLNVTTNSAILTGLEANTQYKAYVRADCGDDGLGRMDSVVFTTGQFGCLGQTELDFSNSTTGQTGCIAYSLYGNTVYQALWTASELTAAGLTAGPISAIDLGFTSSTYAKEFTIFMKSTTTASISNATIEAPGNQVYGPAAHPAGTEGWQHYAFDSAFVWDGTSNIMMTTFMNQPTGTTQTSSSGLTGYYVSASNRARYRYRDSQQFNLNNLTDGSAGSNYSYRAAIHFYVGECTGISTCANPSVIVTDVEATEVTIAWAPGADETSWNIDYRVHGTEAWTSEATAVSTNEYTITNLQDATVYDFRVWFECGDANSTVYAGTAIGTTLCMPKTLPYTENFDNISTSTTAADNYGVMPLCWDYTLTGTSTYTTDTYLPGVYYGTAYAASGSYCLRLAGVGVFELPEMGTQLDSLRISFSDSITSASYNGLVVGVMENGQFLPLDTVDLALGTRNYIEVMLSDYHGTSRTIALKNFYATSTTTYYSYQYIDDIVVDYIPQCSHVNNLTVDSIGEEAVVLSWTPVGVDATWLVVSETGNISVTTGDTVVTITGLTPNTPYTFEVYSLCGLGDTSEAASINVRTACSVMPVPFYENFDSYTSLFVSTSSSMVGGMVPCWEYIPSANGGYMTFVNSGTYLYGGSGMSLKFKPGTATSQDIVALPVFNQPISNLEMTFQTRPEGTGSSPGSFDVGYIANVADASTFVSVEHYNYSDFNGAYQEKTVTFAGAPATARIAFRHNTASAAYYWFVDEVDVHVAPSCNRPMSVAVSSVTATSADVHIADTTGVMHYRLYFNNGTTVDSVDIYDTTYTATTLQPSSTYTLSVRSICEAGDITSAVSTSFNTICGQMGLPVFYDPNNYATGSSTPLPNCWTRTNNATGTTNYYPYIYSSSTNAHTGNNTLYYYFSTSSGYANDEVMAFPEIDVANFPMNTTEVIFWAKSSVASKPFMVGVMTDPTDVSTFVAIDTIILTTTCSEYSVLLNNYTGTGAYVALRGVMDGTSSYYIYVDDIYIGVMSHCPRVYDLTAYDGTATGATLEWTDTIGSTSWVIEYQQYGTTNDTTVTATSNPYTLTGLTANTLYTYRVAPVCSDGTQADWSRESYTFSTSQVPATVPYTYNFEDGAEWANWQTLSNNTVKWSRGNVVGNPGYSMYLSTDNGVTRSMDMTSITNSAVYRDFDFGATPVSYELSFDALVGGSTDGNYDGITVMVVDPAIVPEVSSTGLTSPWGHIGSVDVRMDTVWADESVYLDGMQGVKRLVFFHFNQATASTHPYIDSPDAIDNIAIGLQPCARPYDLAASNVTDQSALLSWAGPANATYIVAHRVYGSPATANVYDTVSTNSLLLTGLNSDEEYIFWAMHVCSVTATDTLVSDWSNGFRFTTECTIYTLPYLETFDSVAGTTYNTAGVLPECWRAFSNGTNDNYIPHVVSSGSYWYSVGSTPALTMTSGSETYGSTKIVALPPFNAPVSACGIRFHYRHENASNGTLEIGYVTSADLEATFHPLVALPGTTTMTQIDSTLLSGAPANATRIALRWIYTTSFYSVGIDNIEVWANELCPAPTATVSNIEAQAATVTVTGSGIAYELEYGTDNANLGNTMTSTTGVFNLTGLEPETQYFFSVRQQCDSTLFSSWYTGSFTTDELGCMAPTALAVTATDYTSASFSWTIGNEETAWQVHVFSNTIDTIVTSTTTSATVNGLQADMPYSAAVRALCGTDSDIPGPWSDTVSFTTAACEAVTSVNVAAGSTTANVSWTGTSTSYRVIWGLLPFNPQDLEGEAIVSTNSYIITGLDEETDYAVVIYNNCAEGISVPSTPVNFTTTSGGVEPTIYTVTVVANNPAWGTVTGSGPYAEGTTATITATANDGYRFVEWDDHNTDNPRSFTVTADMSFTATFEAVENGIEDVVAGTVSLYPNPASTSVTLGLEGFEGESQVEVVDMNGRVVIRHEVRDSKLEMNVSELPQGAYFVRVTSGTRTAISKLIVK